jgi:hypothetical protein
MKQIKEMKINPNFFIKNPYEINDGVNLGKDKMKVKKGLFADYQTIYR